jgi:hypothetical protein
MSISRNDCSCDDKAIASTAALCADHADDGRPCVSSEGEC